MLQRFSITVSIKSNGMGTFSLNKNVLALAKTDLHFSMSCRNLDIGLPIELGQPLRGGREEVMVFDALSG